MDNMILYASISIFTILLLYKFCLSKTTPQKNLPPSPRYGLPFIGHLHLMRRPIHRGLEQLSKKYGPVMLLKFGGHNVIIVSSPSIAEECFTKKDSILASRPTPSFFKQFSYYDCILATVPYGDKWRTLRRITNNEIFATPRLNSFADVRKDETMRLCCKLYGAFRDNSNHPFRVKMRETFNGLTFNVIMRMAAGKRYYDDDKLSGTEEAKEFAEIVSELIHIGGSAKDLEALFPMLKFVTGNRFEKKLRKVFERSDKFMECLLDEAKNRKGGSKSSTMLDHLLALQKLEPNIYTDMFIKGSIFVLLIGGTDTIRVTFEWVMTNLINHPEILKKARSEIDSVLGQSKLMEESDISKLHYLQMIILETLRLHPPIPLLLPHYSISDCTIGGYDVPKETTILVDAWGIQRNPAYWDDPTSFKPERFENMKKVGNFKMIPFGGGRRGCPGEDMSFLVLALGLASLIQCFDWERISEQQIDITEDRAVALVMPQAEPLEALCKARDIAHKFLA